MMLLIIIFVVIECMLATSAKTKPREVLVTRKEPRLPLPQPTARETFEQSEAEARHQAWKIKNAVGLQMHYEEADRIARRNSPDRFDTPSEPMPDRGDVKRQMLGGIIGSMLVK